MNRDIKVVFDYNTIEKHIESEYVFEQFCNDLSTLISSSYLKETAIRIIKKDFFYFLPAEQNMILNDVINAFDSDDLTQYIYNKLKDWFFFNYDLNVRGFLNFRLKEYYKIIYVYVQNAIDRYIIELEKNHIIDYFKNILVHQEPYINTIYIYSANGSYKIMNQDYKNIMTINDCDELLLNVMVSIAPENIYFYGTCKNTKFFNTLLSVFENRIKIIN